MAQHLGSGTRSIPPRLRKLGYNSYAEYLASEHWQDVRQRYRASRLRKKCKGCGDPTYELHHRTYERLGREHLWDLVPLCRKCHQATHDHVRSSNADLFRGTKGFILKKKRQRHRKQKREGWRKSKAATVACPRCGARPGSPCRGSRGGVVAGGHLARQTLARA